ncbi:MAG: hypothetical protein ACXWNS_04740 [Isosphaeraceae bacterium]
MQLRHQGAKRSMRKHLALNWRRRPSLDSLESRYLLSGGIEVIEVRPAPALVIGIDFRQTPYPADGFRSLAISSFSSGPGNWPMPGFHHGFSPLGEWATPAPEFHAYSDPQVVSPWISSISESGNAAVSTPNSESVSESVAAAPAPPSHGDVPPGLWPPPGQPPPFLFLGGDPRILHAARDLSTKPLQDEMTLDSAGDTTQSQADEVTVSPPGNQSAVLAQGGNSIGQIASSVIASPGHLSALFSPKPGHDDQSIRTARIGDSPGNHPVEAAQGNLPKSGPANLVTTDGSTADGAAHRGDAVSASMVDPRSSGNQTKLLLPQAAGLIANVVPFDQAAMEKAVDQFFDQLENLGMGQLVEQGPTRVIPLSLALLSTVTALEVARRRLKSRTGERKATERQNPLGSEELLGFPELPGSWSTNLT